MRFLNEIIILIVEVFVLYSIYDRSFECRSCFLMDIYIYIYIYKCPYLIGWLSLIFRYVDTISPFRCLIRHIIRRWAGRFYNNVCRRSYYSSFEWSTLELSRFPHNIWRRFFDISWTSSSRSFVLMKLSSRYHRRTLFFPSFTPIKFDSRMIF